MYNIKIKELNGVIHQLHAQKWSGTVGVLKEKRLWTIIVDREMVVITQQHPRKKKTLRMFLKAVADRKRNLGCIRL